MDLTRVAAALRSIEPKDFESIDVQFVIQRALYETLGHSGSLLSNAEDWFFVYLEQCNADGLDWLLALTAAEQLEFIEGFAKYLEGKTSE